MSAAVSLYVYEYAFVQVSKKGFAELGSAPAALKGMSVLFWPAHCLQVFPAGTYEQDIEVSFTYPSETGQQYPYQVSLLKLPPHGRFE